MTLVAGVDSSTQSCKVMIRDASSGEVVRTGCAGHADGTEVDPNVWWDALLAALAGAGGVDDVAAISIAAQQHGMVALDAAGEVIRPALLWNDTRSAQAAAALVAEFGAAQLVDRTGSVPVASFTATKLRWLRDAEPEHAARVAAVALPHDWLTWNLRGGPTLGLDALTTDRSDASGTGYWNPLSGEYDREVLIAALGHDVVLPRVLPPHERAGVTSSGTLVGAGAGDNAGAALGLGARPGEVVVSIGTSGTVFAVSHDPINDSTGTIAGFADATGVFLPLVATLNAARVLDAAADLLGVDHQELARLALSAEPGSGGLVLHPYFEGERTPNLPDATATLTGMSLASTTRENLARAAVEGMLCGLADGLAALSRHGVSARRVLLIGGGAQNPAVQVAASQIFGVPIAVPKPGEYVALGAAAQAAWVLTGEMPSWDTEVAIDIAADPRPELRRRYSASAI